MVPCHQWKQGGGNQLCRLLGEGSSGAVVRLHHRAPCTGHLVLHIFCIFDFLQKPPWAVCVLPRSFLNLLARVRQGRLKTQPTSTAAPEIFCVGDALPSQQARLLFAGFFARGFCPGEAQDDENLDKKCKKKFSCEISLVSFIFVIIFRFKIDMSCFFARVRVVFSPHRLVFHTVQQV